MREEIESRPSACLIIGLILGLITFNYPLACIGLVGFLAWLMPARCKALISGAFVVGLALSPMPPAMQLVAAPLHGVAEVTSVPLLYPDAQVCEVLMSDRTLQLTLPKEPAVMLGDLVRVAGIAKPLQASPRTHRFDQVQARIEMGRVEVIRQGPWVAHLADSWRRSFRAFLETNLSPKNAALVDAVCFNARTMLDSQTKEEMARSGSVHIVSASGLQVFVFGALITLALRFFPMPRSLQILILAGVLAVYALASGLQPQIVRAVAMTLLGLTAYLVKRDPDALSALAVSGIVYLLWRPEAVYGMSFQLSFVTIACIALFFQRTPDVASGWKRAFIRRANDFLKLSGIVVLATAPLVAYYLGVISMVSVFSNLILCWSLPLMVGAAFFAHAVSFVLPAVGDGIAVSCLSPLCHWIYGSLDWVGGESSSLQVPNFSFLWLLAFYGAWAMTYRRRVVQP